MKKVYYARELVKAGFDRTVTKKGNEIFKKGAITIKHGKAKTGDYIVQLTVITTTGIVIADEKYKIANSEHTLYVEHYNNFIYSLRALQKKYGNLN